MASTSPRPLTCSAFLEVRCTPYTGEEHARGVFALAPIVRGTLIELSHCLTFDAKEHAEHAMKTVLQHYTFCAGGGLYFLALGIGSLFNHADPPNVEFRICRGDATVSFIACKDISPGDELCIFYGRNLWFDAAPGSLKDHGHGENVQAGEAVQETEFPFDSMELGADG